MRSAVLTFAAMATAGGTPWVRSGGWLLGLLVGIFGCGDRHLTAIKPSQEPQMEGPAPAADCGPDVAAAGFRPPMGWNGWNTFGCGPELDQAKFRANADAMVERGLAAAGYQYMNLDDCWQSGRGADGIVIPNSARFPDGIGALGDYVHAKGLKLGIDTCSAGCQRPELVTPGSLSYEAQDAQSYASWGVDFVKYTSSGSSDDGEREVFTAMRDALNQTGRPMLLSIVDAPFKYWHSEVGQMWRTHSDVQPTWDGILSIVDDTNKVAAYAGLRGYNDSDMLWVGNPGLSEAESRAHFTMWAILASPLLAGNDLSEMSEVTQAILTNREIIALDQDALGLQGVLLDSQAQVQVYAKPLAGCGERAVVLLNRGSEPAQVELSLAQLGLESSAAGLRDLWTGSDLEALSDSRQLTVPGHDVVALRVTGTEPDLPRGEVFLSDLRWSYAANGWGPVERDQELGGIEEADGAQLTLGGISYAKGLGTNSPSLVRYRLGKACQELTAEIGIDDLTGDSGSVVFQVWADGAKLFDSGVMYGSTPPRQISVDVSGRSELRLLVAEVEDFGLDHGNWADARLRCDE